jgi:hypothetical protein
LSDDERAAEKRRKAAAYARKWRLANLERSKEIKERYRKSHPEICRACNRRSRDRHRDKINAKHREWRLANLERERAKDRERGRKEYRSLTPERVRAKREQERKWRAANRDRYRELLRRHYERKRRENQVLRTVAIGAKIHSLIEAFSGSID